MGGGSVPDNSAAIKAAQDQADLARQQAQQEQARWETEQARIQKESADAVTASEAQKAKDRQDALDKLQADADAQTKQAAAQSATGGKNASAAVYDPKTMTAAAYNAGLPGMGSLQNKLTNRYNAPNPNSNILSSTTGVGFGGTVYS